LNQLKIKLEKIINWKVKSLHKHIESNMRYKIGG